MMAAIAAARNGAAVTVLEAMERPGKKLLLTGNGRCNLTNMEPDLPIRYSGSGRGLAKSVTRRFGAADCRQFFLTLGLLTTEKNGLVYPYTLQSSSVLEALLGEMRRLGVKLKCSERIVSVVPPSDRKKAVWQIKTESWSYEAQAVILACGSRCLPATGSDGSGYALAEMAGHTVTETYPALVPLVCRGDFFAAAAGVRCLVEVAIAETIRSENGTAAEYTVLCRERGELQWTKYGISGIVVFQLSRYVSAYCGKGQLSAVIDLLPDFDQEALAAILKNRADEIPGEPLSVLLRGMLHEKLIPVILKYLKQKPGTLCKNVSANTLETIVSLLKQLSIPVKKTKSFEECQVCAGGVCGTEVLEETLESKYHSGLYFAGELLDIDGPCGGYNLQWAWASGFIAGTAAAGGQSGMK